MENNLPQGWEATPLEYCCDILDNLRVPINSDERAKRTGNVPYYGATGQVGFIDDFIFNEELILIGEDGAPFFDKTKKIAYRIKGKSWVNNHAHVLRAKNDITSNCFLEYFLCDFNYTGFVNGTTRLKLNQGSLKTIPFPLPPLSEQHRIVAKLDAVMQKVESNKQRLDKIPKLLKRFRQSVLAAAVSGKLTEEWREKNGVIEEWEEKTLRELSIKLTYGSSSKSELTGKIPVLRMGNIQEGKIVWDDLKYSSDEDEIKKYKLENGDVLFNRTNSPELVGKTAIYRNEQPAIYAGYLIKIKTNKNLDPEFLNLCLNTIEAREWCNQVKTDGVSQSNINAQKLAEFIIATPHIEEQKEIVRQVEQLFALADKIEARYTKAKTMLDKLPQSILAKAFRGELVAQDPNDEPASVLLERIKLEKEKLAAEKKGKKTKK